MVRDDPMTLLVFELFQTHGALIRFGDQFAQEHGLSSASWQVLGAIARADGGMTVSQIARRMGQARQSVQRQTNFLVELEYVTLEHNPDHRRSPLVALTKAGLRVHNKLQRAWDAEIGSWSKTRKRDLNSARTVIQQMRENLSRYLNG